MMWHEIVLDSVIAFCSYMNKGLGSQVVSAESLMSFKRLEKFMDGEGKWR